MKRILFQDLEDERKELERHICWFGYEIIEAQDHGTHVIFKVRRRKAVET